MLLRRRGQTLKGEALFLYSFLCIVFFCSSVTRKSYSWHLSGYLTKSTVSKIIDYPDTKSIIHVKRAERKLFYKTWILHSRGFQGFLLWGVTSEHHCLIHPPIETCHLRFLTLPSTCGKKTISPFDSHYGPVHCRCGRVLFSACKRFSKLSPVSSDTPQRVFKKIGIAVHGCRTFHRRVPAIKSCYFSPRRLRRAVSYMCSSKYVGVQLLICHISSEAGMKTLCERKRKEAVDNSCSHYRSVRI